MTLSRDMAQRIAYVLLMALAYAVLLSLLVVSSRREASLAPQVIAAEQSLRQMSTGAGAEALKMRADLTTLRAQVAALEARLPADVQSGVFERVARDAQASGISDFRYQRKGEYVETLQAGTYKVHRYSIQGRGSQQVALAFLDGLQQDSGLTLLLETVTLTASGNEWVLSADILIYTTGG